MKKISTVSRKYSDLDEYMGKYGFRRTSIPLTTDQELRSVIHGAGAGTGTQVPGGEAEEVRRSRIVPWEGDILNSMRKRPRLEK